jgi:DNA modification methylase
MAGGLNTLYYGDNLDVLRRHIADESVDLVYLDPPFKSNADYNVLFSERGVKAAAQVQAFTDTWQWDTQSRAAYEETVELGGRPADAMRAFRTLLGGSDMLAYLSMMAPRLIELRRVLKPSGSIWLHCDATASHYLKILLDAVFGPKNYRNEVIWHYAKFQMRAMRRFVKNTDRLLFYVKDESSDYSFNPQTIPLDKPKRYLRKQWSAELGRIVNYKDALGKTVMDEYADQRVDDVWDIPYIAAPSKERLGYPTQKPIKLLARILEASSKPGDLVLDPFCGCGTTIDAAQVLGRRWVGIDVTHLSIGLIRHRLVDRHGPDIGKTYRVIGEPTTVDDARVLAKEDPFQFQAWALGLVGARVAGSDKKGGDRGIDGRLYFHEGKSETRQIVFSVKAGHLVPNYVRDLRGVIEREAAEIGVLLSFEEPTAGMRSEAAEAGFHESPWGKHPRIQLRTIRELLDGRGVDYPHVTGANVTHRRAARAAAAPGQQAGMFESTTGSPTVDEDDDDAG